MASADLFQKLLSRLNSIRGKSRRGSGVTSRSYDERKAISDARQRDYDANQNRYHGDFKHSGGFYPPRDPNLPKVGRDTINRNWNIPNWAVPIKEIDKSKQPIKSYDHRNGQPRDTRKKLSNLKGSELIQARKAHQARLDARNARIHNLAKDF